ncbi:MAG: low molecular weight phosphotyrosine protein phosphatase [Bacteroidetes bacterium]|nr:low molecular weight phosphotyrosine protein phosphatase [Bacteroidota bacterium]MDA1334184.1 low molecular weight phosphotyrosine protein phosphatase [Bacteroidota bacterium]
MSDQFSVLFVCLGNICRSPVAEGVFRHQVEEAGLTGAFTIDSAGTGAWHVGQSPDSRMTKSAASQGVDISKQHARQFVEEDLERFDLILAMDKSNLHDILYLDKGDTFGHKVKLFREWDPEPGDFQVPDPYYGGDEGFRNVFTMVERTSQALLGSLKAHYGV